MKNDATTKLLDDNKLLKKKYFTKEELKEINNTLFVLIYEDWQNRHLIQFVFSDFNKLVELVGKKHICFKSERKKENLYNDMLLYEAGDIVNSIDERFLYSEYDFTNKWANNVIDIFENNGYSVYLVVDGEEPVLIPCGYRISPENKIYRLLSENKDINKSHRKQERMEHASNNEALKSITKALEDDVEKEKNINPLLYLTHINKNQIHPCKFTKDKAFESEIVYLINRNTRKVDMFFSIRDASRFIAKSNELLGLKQTEEDVENYRTNIKKAIKKDRKGVGDYIVVGGGKYIDDQLTKSDKLSKQYKKAFESFYYSKYSDGCVQNKDDYELTLKLNYPKVLCFSLVGLKASRLITDRESYCDYISLIIRDDYRKGINSHLDIYQNLYSDCLKEVDSYLKYDSIDDYIEYISINYINMIKKICDIKIQQKQIVKSMKDYYLTIIEGYENKYGII